jgi:hypothetical protein
MPEQSAAERNRWTVLTEGLPFASLAELVISVQCLGNNLEDSAALLRSLDRHSPSSGEFGFADEQADEATAREE